MLKYKVNNLGMDFEKITKRQYSYLFRSKCLSR